MIVCVYVYVCTCRKEFEHICKRDVMIPGLVVMKDVSIAKSEFVQGQKAVTKLQDFQEDPELFCYCTLPQVHTYSNTHYDICTSSQLRQTKF